MPLFQVDEEWQSTDGALAAGVVVGDFEAIVDGVDGVCDGLVFAGEYGRGIGGVQVGFGAIEW